MKKLGFGLMRLPVMDPNNPNSQIDIEKSKKLVDKFMEKGYTHFDTAYMYHGGKSEGVFKKIVVEKYDRDSYTVTDKMPIFNVEKKEDLEIIFNEQLERCGLEYFDYYWLHSLTKKHYETAEKMNAFKFLEEKKKEGKIKHIGFSYHDDAKLLDEILTKHEEVECVQLQINYIDWESENIQSRKCYEVALKHNKEIMIMEPVKGGALASVPEEVVDLFKKINPEDSVASWAMRFAASLDNVSYVLSGMTEMFHMEDNIKIFDDLRPLNEEEMEAIKEAVEIINSKIEIPCTNCRYCVDDCPSNIAIPEYFKMYNDYKQYNKFPYRQFKNMFENHGRPSDCIKCGNCESICPQPIEIIDCLEEISKMEEE